MDILSPPAERPAGARLPTGEEIAAYVVGAAGSRPAGVVCMLTTTNNRPVDWVNAGQALQRVLLTSATCGVAAALHSQPLELPRLCEFIRTQLGDGTYPQLVLRLGRVIQIAVRVRLPASALFPGGEHLGSSYG